MTRHMMKVDRLAKRVRAKVIHKQADRERVAARRWVISIEVGRPFKLELRIARTAHLMRTEVMRLHGPGKDMGPECRGAVLHYQHRFGHKHRVVRGQVVCAMYLNAKDIQDDGANIIAHECTHAGLAYARNRRADLDHMPGEEVAAYAVGRLTREVCAIARYMRIW
ncbi:MAG: hypothetical protein V4631_22155 [Pseudomonadota bacterium]